MKNKIAIMTQPLGHNYGGIIQNYALQKILNKLGKQTITINRIEDNPHSKIKILASRYKTLFYRHILQTKNPAFLDYKRVQEHNLRFLEKYINSSPVLGSTSALKEYFNREEFSAVIVGSDQVWRPKYSPNILNFFLDFLQSDISLKKVAYAASFGTEEWEFTEDETLECSKLIQQFNAVSVREDSGVKLCQEFLNRSDAKHVLDPTLLLEAEDYSKLIGIREKKKGLYTYVLDSSKIKTEFIINCSKKLNLEIFTNQAKYSTNNLESNNFDDYIIPPLEGWLQGFRDADFVITDSFHGTIFSIINKKPFITLVNEERGASRFNSFLSQLGLEERLVKNLNEFQYSILKKEIDYDNVNLKLDILRSESLDFLSKNI